MFFAPRKLRKVHIGLEKKLCGKDWEGELNLFRAQTLEMKCQFS